MLDCVTQCSQSAAHLHEQFLQVQQIGYVTLGPNDVYRGACLELYYCNIVEWFWWDSRLISTTNWFPSVLWHCWFGHLACKNCPRNDLLCVEWDVKPYTLTDEVCPSKPWLSDGRVGNNSTMVTTEVTNQSVAVAATNWYLNLTA